MMGRFKVLLAVGAGIIFYTTFCGTCRICKKSVWIWQNYKMRLSEKNHLIICYEHEECVATQKRNN